MKNQFFTILIVLISTISLNAQTYTEQSSIFMMPLYSVHASWADYNNDGYLDVAYTDVIGGYAGAVTYLYKNSVNLKKKPIVYTMGFSIKLIKVITA